MRVGFVMEQALAPVAGGTGRFSVELAGALAASADPDSADAISGWVSWHRDCGPAAVRGVAGPSRLPLPRRALIAAWERGVGPAPRGVDVVHAPTPLFPPRRGRPLVVTVHDTVPWTHPELLTERGARWHRAMVERAAAQVDAVTVPTQAVAAELAALVPALPAHRIHVIGEGVSAVVLDEPVPAVVARVGADLPNHYLLSLATVEPRKGLDVLIDALARLGPPALPLLVVGAAGWGGIDPLRLARDRGLAEGAVRVLGRVPDADLAVLLRRAAALVMPSRAEGFGLPVLEAMAVGTPVVCSDVPALVEVAGGAAVVTAVGDADALAAGIEDALHRADDLVAAGRVRAAQFSWSATAERTWALYRSLS